MTRDEGKRKKSRLGGILMWLLIAAGLFIMLFAVLRLAGWVVHATFPEEALSGGIQPRTAVIHQNHHWTVELLSAGDQSWRGPGRTLT